MEPFTIQCSSCQSRIRVRNPSMIGQIANCPKCGSMIMIAAPQQILVDSGTGAVTDSAALTKESLPMPEHGRFDNANLLDQSFRNGGVPEPVAPEPNVFESLDSNSWLPESTAPPRVDEVRVVETQENGDSSRQVLIIAAIGLCSVLLACSAFFIFLKWFAPASVVAQNKSQAIVPQVNNPPRDGAESRNQLDAAALDPIMAVAPPALDNRFPAIEPAVGTNAQPAASDTQPAASDTQPAASELQPTPSDSSSSGSAIAPGGAVDPPVVPKDSTLRSGSPLAGQTPDIESTFENPATVADPRAVKEPLPPGLQNFASLFDQALVPVLSDATVPLGAAPDGGDVQPSQGDNVATSSPMALALPETLEQKLTLSISGLRIRNRPLAEVLTSLALASDVPFTIDFDALLAAGVDRNMTLDFTSIEATTIAQLLTKISQESGLSFEPYEKKLLIARADSEKIKARSPSSLPIDDLVSDSDQSEALSKAISELLPELGGPLEIRDGAFQADLDRMSPVLWYQVARVLQTWRGLRGIDNSTASTLVPESSRLPAWPVAPAKEIAQKKISQVILPEPLAQSWQRLVSEVGMVCWIDWPGLQSAQIPPQKISMAVSQDRPLQDLLQYYANKYELFFALENERTLWVTTPDMHRFQPRLYVLPMQGKSVAEWTKDLEPLTPYDPVSGAGTLRVVSAPDGQFIFVRCCRPLLARPEL